MNSLLLITLTGLLFMSGRCCASAADTTTTTASRMSSWRYGWAPPRKASSLLLQTQQIQRQQREQRDLQDEDEDEFTNQSDDAFDLERVFIGDFKVKLDMGSSAAMQQLETNQLDHLHNEIQGAIFRYIENSAADVTVDYIFMRQITQDDSAGQEETVVSFPNGGIAAFRGGTAPTATELDVWVRHAVESQLSTQLQQTAEFSSIVSTEYLSDRIVTDNDGGGGGGVAGIQLDDKGLPQDDDDTDLSWLYFVAAGVGGMVIAAALVFLLVMRNKQRHSSPANQHLSLNESNTGPVEITSADLLAKSVMDRNSPGNHTVETWDDVEHNNEQHHSSRRPPTAPVSASARGSGGSHTIFPRSHTDESKSQAGSESSFTVNSEAGDSTGLQSIHASKQQAQQQAAQQQAGTVPAALRAESFERDRRVNLRKDMLTSPWAASNSLQGRGNSAVQVESVLEPSHFSASQERRARNPGNIVMEENAHAWANGQDVGQETGVANANAAAEQQLRFESPAGDDDAFLHPPSSRGGKKTGGEFV